MGLVIGGVGGTETTGAGDDGEEVALSVTDELIRGGFLRGAGWLLEGINSISSGGLACSEPVSGE